MYGVRDTIRLDRRPTLGLDPHGEVLDLTLDELIHAIGEGDEAVVLDSVVAETVHHPHCKLGDRARESVVHLGRPLAAELIGTSDERKPAVIEGLWRNADHLSSRTTMVNE